MVVVGLRVVREWGCSGFGLGREYQVKITGSQNTNWVIPKIELFGTGAMGPSAEVTGRICKSKVG